MLERPDAYELLRVMIQEINGEDPSNDEIEEKFTQIDTNSTGYMDKQECMNFL